jgi:hypothetical protein
MSFALDLSPLERHGLNVPPRLAKFDIPYVLRSDPKLARYSQHDGAFGVASNLDIRPERVGIVGSTHD